MSDEELLQHIQNKNQQKTMSKSVLAAILAIVVIAAPFGMYASYRYRVMLIESVIRDVVKAECLK